LVWLRLLYEEAALLSDFPTNLEYSRRREVAQRNGLIYAIKLLI